MDIKNMHEMLEKLVGCAKAELDKKGIEQIDAEEMGKVTDIIKDLAEAQYYRTLVVAMEESEYGEDYDEEGPIDSERRGYRGQPRSKTSGRYMSRGDGRRSNRGRMGYEEHMMYDEARDMDRDSMGRMYYAGSGSGSSGGSSGSGSMQSGGGMSRNYGGESGGGSRNYGGQYSSRSENARRGYKETKEMQDNSPEGKKKAMESLEHYMKELGEDMTELVGQMDATEKALLKSKLATLVQKIQ